MRHNEVGSEEKDTFSRTGFRNKFPRRRRPRIIHKRIRLLQTYRINIVEGREQRDGFWGEALVVTFGRPPMKTHIRLSQFVFTLSTKKKYILVRISVLSWPFFSYCLFFTVSLLLCYYRKLFRYRRNRNINSKE